MRRFCVVLTLFMALPACAGLPPGIAASPEELATCEAKGGCTVWTGEELMLLGKKFFGLGYTQGTKDRGETQGI